MQLYIQAGQNRDCKLCCDFEDSYLLHLMHFGAEIFHICSSICLVYVYKTVFSSDHSSFRYGVLSDRGLKQSRAELAEHISEFEGRRILTQILFIDEILPGRAPLSLVSFEFGLTLFAFLEIKIWLF